MAASYLPVIYSNFYASVDVVDWDENSSQAFGLLARSDGAQGAMYCVYWTTGSGIASFRLGNISTGSFASKSIRLNPGLPHRFVFTGSGPEVVGELYALTNLAVPLARLAGSSTVHERGYVGVGVQPWAAFATADATYDNFRVLPSPPPPVIRRQPSGQTVEEGRAVSFAVEAEGYFLSFQWYADGLPIVGATGPSHTLPVATLLDDGTAFSVAVSSPAGEGVSSNAQLRVVPDVTPPRLVSAVAAANLTEIELRFSEPVRALEAEDLFNYELTSTAGVGAPGVTEVRLIRPDSVLLTTTPRVEGEDYVLTVFTMRDVSPVAHELAPSPTRRGLTRERILVNGDGQEWRYFQSDRAPPAGWQQLSFDDTAAGWASGSAPFDAKWPPGRTNLGPEQIPVRTILDLTNPPTAPEITRTYYFRTHFILPEFRPGTTLRLQPLVDDGAVFYLNGEEVCRLNLPPVPALIGYSTLALVPRGNEQLVFEVPCEIPAHAARAGDNVLAVEVHQCSVDSSDVSFAARLTALIPPPPARLQIDSSEAGFRISWTGAGFVLEEAPSVEGNWSLSRNQENPQLVQPSPGGKFFRLR